uniref:Uncharacterized protein TCIL3000_11_16590 n=1 Tax=Trypanosoma congolense (strain IL3000) TaxID=1068625 RepID=G0V3C4_TRYCI|nr:unnamed protein product [Trypanosoma congolense IL3000]
MALHTIITMAGLSGDEACEILSPSPLVKFAKSHFNTIVSNADIKNELRRRGLLLLISGVMSASVHDGATTDASYQELSLRESMLLHHKRASKTSSSKARPAARSNTRSALTPTTVAATPKPKKVAQLSPSEAGSRGSRKRQTAAVGPVGSSAHGDPSTVGVDHSDMTLKEPSSTGRGSSDCFVGEQHGEVEEFHL